MKRCLVLILILFFTSLLMAQPENFSTSLHKMRSGKAFWYNADTSQTHASAPGFEALSNVPIDSLGCTQCHGPVDANGDAYPTPFPGANCNDCHKTTSDFSVAVGACYNCHGRQKTEAMALKLPDVHRDKGMMCWDCHSSADIHGDGTQYNSLMEDGAIDADCENCHVANGGRDGAPMPDHTSYDPHSGKLSCAACHAKTVISCYNCHFESQVESHLKRAYKPINDFVMLANRTKDGKVYPATFQSLSYKDTTFMAFGAFSPHTIMDKGRTCSDCHNNANVQEYDQTGQIKFTTWNFADSMLTWKHGIVPIPYDYDQSLRMDFITYMGATSDPIAPSKNWTAIGKDTWDGGQMMFITPLTEQQMDALSEDFSAVANFDSSLHGTRPGKQYWYGKENGGFENWTNVPISELGCAECHGPKNADGVANGPDYKPSCVDCHPSNSNFSKDSLSVSQCYSCHSRQATEAVQMDLPDVHRDAGMVCWDCHSMEDMHGSDTKHVSMLETGAIDADCEDCHSESGSQGAPNHSYQHSDKVSCAACHAKTVISCYNCHFESQVDNHIKRAKQKLNDFVILANREKDGKVYPMSFQSLTNNGDAFVAFGPFSPHTIMNPGRACADCHQNFGGNVDAITQYNASGEIKFATWNDADSTLSWTHGVVPMPADYEKSFKMDFITYNGNTSDPAGPSKNWSAIGKDTWDGHQMFFATPLTKDQMGKLGFDTTLTAIASNDATLPVEFALLQNYPNPFNPSTNIEFHLPAATKVTMKIFNILGAEVQTILANEKYTAGVHKVKFSANGLASGIYFYQIVTPKFQKTRKMFLLK